MCEKCNVSTWDFKFFLIIIISLWFIQDFSDIKNENLLIKAIEYTKKYNVLTNDNETSDVIKLEFSDKLYTIMQYLSDLRKLSNY